MRTSTITLLVFLLGPPALSAQHEHSPYAGVATAEGTALTADEIRQLRNGEGMGLSLAAELNHYPGPKHVLELADSLSLDPTQLTEIEAIREVTLAEAVRKGEEIITVEAHLAEAFRTGTASAVEVGRMTQRLGTLRGQLQAIHLVAHLETRLRLTDTQVQMYDQLRGYRAPDPQ